MTNPIFPVVGLDRCPAGGTCESFRALGHGGDVEALGIPVTRESSSGLHRFRPFIPCGAAVPLLAWQMTARVGVGVASAAATGASGA